MQSPKAFEIEGDELRPNPKFEEDVKEKQEDEDREMREPRCGSKSEENREAQDNPEPPELPRKVVLDIVDLLEDFLKKRAHDPRHYPHRRTCKWLKQVVPSLFFNVFRQPYLQNIQGMTAELWDEGESEEKTPDWIGERGARALVMQIAASLENEVTKKIGDEWVYALTNIFEAEADQEPWIEDEVEVGASAAEG
ncbi:hypothetical protein FKW77_000106 [Venturia effusa]|uniref:Uncharacterized protein n=1 Tax=Venturia effusa TaxID=50376 RepID=A0A517L2G4_9PEZI|nr:hypothetical protein FKW77_000106 [Venturia effusa]